MVSSIHTRHWCRIRSGTSEHGALGIDRAGERGYGLTAFGNRARDNCRQFGVAGGLNHTSAFPNRHGSAARGDRDMRRRLGLGRPSESD